ncbi:hypothetical protein MJO28_015630 [Puccinia striiformis f. sp. tritici]|uniref:Uncharacterized protein n=5 Tax=Puccinia striiformis TaxID=27350 RepID=A0A0L0VNU0_9BASI|nr:hypothetical protein MJO28_015630 [Puccinia striiformis f. sp. tritici]KAI9614334.1 hypothetical protein H4Q26_009482 [Puccinia striiformis f. sp. tritici PST-130]KNF00948.1 hypothetical protein PSTG_05843 [Puccinia striiformis f. sp. tritici PST-78]POW02159.1 hypothetical protein PSHT_12187 [Puccinia striiformis]KAI9624193.1 hypothetical protein KEM48_009091 [Puccinia striiformis f. sp. tritici PST-130]
MAREASLRSTIQGMTINERDTPLEELSDQGEADNEDEGSVMQTTSTEEVDSDDDRERERRGGSGKKNGISPIPTPDDLSHCRQLGDLAICGFHDLNEKYNRIMDTDEGTNIYVQRRRSIAPATDYSQGEHFTELTSRLLPMLKQQVAKIPLIPEPDDSPAEAARKLKLIIEVQAELSTTIGQTRYAINALRPTPLGRCGDPPDDQHWWHLKRFRLSGLNVIFELHVLNPCLHYLFYRTASKIRLRRLTNHPVYEYDACDLFAKEGSVEMTLEKIDELIRCLEASELDLLQDDWSRDKEGLESDIETLYSLAYPTNQPQETNRPNKPPSQRVTQLAQLALPVVKLSRMVFNKLSRRGGMYTEGLPLFTKMCSVELANLCRFARDVSKSVGHLTSYIEGGYRPDMYLRTYELEQCFKYPLSLIHKHILPLLPDTNHFPNRTYYKNWFATWSTEFDLAITNLRAADRNN